MRIKLQDDNGQAFVGIGSIWLLENIQSTGSIRAGAAEMELSYPKALKIIKNLEENLGFAVVTRTKGGNTHGGAELTPAGLLFLEEFRKFHNDIQAEADRRSSAFWSVIQKAGKLATGLLLGLALVVGACTTAPAEIPAVQNKQQTEFVQVVDAAGRTVRVPKNVRKVAAAGPPAAVLLYVVAPELMAGWCTPLAPESLKLLPEEVQNLPHLGRLSGRGGTASYEQFIKNNVELIVDFGDVGGTYISLANRVQEQTGIPYLLLDGSLDKSSESLAILGKALGKEETVAGKIAQADQLLALAAAAKKANMQVANPLKIYLAKGSDGLESAGNGAIHSQLLQLIGLENVVANNGSHGLVKTSLEQVYGANPDIILTNDVALAAQLYKSELWQGLPAVKEGRLLALPERPFGWLSDPPSINRLLGIPFFLVLTGRLSVAEAQSLLTAIHLEYFHVPLPSEAEALLEKAAVNVKNN